MAIENWWHRGGTRQWKFLYVQMEKSVMHNWCAGHAPTPSWHLCHLSEQCRENPKTRQLQTSLIFTKTSQSSWSAWFGKGTLWDKNGILMGPYIVCRIVIFGVMRVTEKIVLIDYPEAMISFFFAQKAYGFNLSYIAINSTTRRHCYLCVI